VRAVQQGVAELAVIGDNVPCEGLETFVCNVDQLVLLVPKDHRFASMQSVPVRQAVEEDMIALARSASLTRKVIAAAEAASRSVRIRVQVRSFDAMCRMVSCGLGLAVLPRAAAAIYADALGLVVVRLDGVEVERRLLLAMLERSALSTAAAALVEMIESENSSAPPPS